MTSQPDLVPRRAGLFAGLSVFTTAITFPLIALGAIVRLKGAGLSCPDWPLCYGKVTPLTDVVAPSPAGLQIALEVGHRYVAGAVGLLVLSLMLWAIFGGMPKSVRTWSYVAMATLVPQVVLGGLTVLMKLAPVTVSLHLLFGNLFFAALLVLSVRAVQVARGSLPGNPSRPSQVAMAAVAVLGLTFAQIFLGGWVSASGASLACLDFPLCQDGTLLGSVPSQFTWLQMLHRGVGFLLAAALAALAFLALKDRDAPRAVKVGAVATVGLVLFQIGLGWFNVANFVPVPTSALHTATAALLCGIVTLLCVRAAAMGAPVRTLQPAPLAAAPGAGHPMVMSRVRMDDGLPMTAGGVATMPTVARGRTLGQVARDYVELTKPGIIRLLLVTTFCAMLVAARGLPDLILVFWTLLGMALVSGSANAMNMVYDQDIDAVMARTAHRPLPEERVDAVGALVFATTIGLAGVVLLGALVNPAAALCALGGHLFYVFVYTMWLKRSTPQNIVIGGAAGAAPPLVGWAAVHGDLSVAAWIMFAIIFFWTPPHFWALALYKKLDYKRAGVPMLPVVRGEEHTKRQMLMYTVLLVPVTALLALAHLGWLYAASALVLGVIFIWFSVKVLGEKGSHVWARRMFAYSLLYLALIFAAMSVDALLVDPFFPVPTVIVLAPAG